MLEKKTFIQQVIILILWKRDCSFKTTDKKYKHSLILLSNIDLSCQHLGTSFQVFIHSFCLCACIPSVAFISVYWRCIGILPSRCSSRSRPKPGWLCLAKAKGFLPWGFNFGSAAEIWIIKRVMMFKGAKQRIGSETLCDTKKSLW